VALSRIELLLIFFFTVVVLFFAVSLKAKIQKATAAIEAAKKSGEEFNKGAFAVILNGVIRCKINSFLRAV